MDELAAQAGAAFLWLVVAFAAGIALFFAWPTDPWPWLGPVIAAGAVAGLLVRRRLDVAAAIMLPVLAVGLGVTAAQVRVNVVAAPVLDREIGPLDVSGRVRDVRREPGRIRVILDHVSFETDRTTRKPNRVRLSMPAKHGAPRVGSVIITRAVLSPPERPVVPGGFEYQRYLYFEGIGALGYTLQQWKPYRLPIEPKLILEARQGLEGLRRDISDRILSVVPGDAGAVAVALVTGEQSLITEKQQEAYRASGLVHLLSISGVHMTLLAGVVFMVVRRSLALWPAVALRFDLKKIAAWAALGATTFYVLISGMSVPAVRAYIMVAVVITAIFFDRRVISLRSVALAATALLAIYPEALIGPSFQMSFMAVIALVALYEYARLKPMWRGADGEWTVGKAILIYMAALVVTDLVAGSVTSLFAAYHFNQVPSYSLPANVVAAPVTGLWIMPCALVALALMPFGWDAPVWTLMGAGTAAINSVATTVAQWPGAEVHVPPMTTWAMVCAGFGLIIVCLWRGRLRWVGLVPVVVACVQPWLSVSPDVVIDESGRVIAVSDARGQMALISDRRDRFVRSVIKDRYSISTERWPKAGAENADLGLTCDALGCALVRNDTTVALALTPDAVAEDCGLTQIIIAPSQFVDECRGSFVIDRGNLRRSGSHAVYFRDGRATFETVVDGTGDRVWTRKPAATRSQPTPAPEPEPARADDFGESADESTVTAN